MFGCALVVTVPVVVAEVAVPALVAYVAFATVPVTFAPVIADRAEPLPLTLVNTPLVAPILPTLALPVAFSVPVMLAPVPVTVTMFALPAAEIFTLPLAAGMLTFDVPFA